LNDSEISRVQKYLRDKFGNKNIRLHDRTQTDGSVEVSLGDEFIGVIYRDEEDGEISYAFHMSILDMDLPTVAGIDDD
jgi:hypothetical protein